VQHPDRYHGKHNDEDAMPALHAGFALGLIHSIYRYEKQSLSTAYRKMLTKSHCIAKVASNVKTA
jgi:hypothetical protein